jgi:hypothetical protein
MLGEEDEMTDDQEDPVEKWARNNTAKTKRS